MRDLELNGQTDYEIDFTTDNTQQQQQQANDYWCVKFGLKESETSSGNSRTIKYKGIPKNQGKSFCIRGFVRFQKDPQNRDPGEYLVFRNIHVDSAGKVWWIEKEDMIKLPGGSAEFETTLHEHAIPIVQNTGQDNENEAE